jgi:ureidoglycolate lyase
MGLNIYCYSYHPKFMLMSNTAINYLQSDVPQFLPWHKSKLIQATPESLTGYGLLVDDYKNFPLEIVQWPKPNGRPVDAGTGAQAGTKNGTFEFWWQGDIFYGRNNAVNDEYLLGWSTNPGVAKKEREANTMPERVLLWHANYHPDGGQLFYPLDGSPFVVPLALPGDDVKPANFVTFYFDGTQGLYIHPNVWHEGIFPLVPKAKFYDAQGSVHARVSVNFAKEFDVFLEVPLIKP